MEQDRNPQKPAINKEIFQQAAFIADLGIQLHEVGQGWCETELQIAARHMQQDNFVHAGVQATMADHTAGGAATTLIGGNQFVLTVEFKINLLRPAHGEVLRCRAQVLKPGRTLSVVESEVYAVTGEEQKLVSKAIVTLAVMEKSAG